MTQPAIVCEGTTVPPELLPIYQAASNEYDLGPQGPAVLAAINQIETNFGELNLVTSYAGAIGWMQFMPATWAAYGVDADGNGTADPYDPDDAIFSAANYLSASGMPADTPGAIFAYNHADWYVAEVLANAGCFGSFGNNSLRPDPLAAGPHLHARRRAGATRCPRSTSPPSRTPPAATSSAAAGVWALAAVARLESNFGKAMTKQQLRTYGPLGLDATEWERYAVDGDEDGRIRRAERRRLSRHARPPDLVARQPPRRRLQPQPGQLVRRGGHAGGRADAGRLQGHLDHLGARAAEGHQHLDQLGQPDPAQPDADDRPAERLDRPPHRRPDRDDHPGAHADDLLAAHRPLDAHGQRLGLQPLRRPRDGHRRRRRRALHRHQRRPPPAPSSAAR